jgi:hypothetical protein
LAPCAKPAKQAVKTYRRTLNNFSVFGSSTRFLSGNIFLGTSERPKSSNHSVNTTVFYAGITNPIEGQEVSVQLKECCLLEMIVLILLDETLSLSISASFIGKSLAKISIDDMLNVFKNCINFT